MQSRHFPGSRLREACWDPASGQLDLRWEGGRVDAYRPVPAEVWRRLCSAPNPASYWEDRIAEEYPRVPPRPAPAAGPRAGPTLHDLFGGAADAGEGGRSAGGDPGGPGGESGREGEGEGGR